MSSGPIDPIRGPENLPHIGRTDVNGPARPLSDFNITPLGPSAEPAEARPTMSGAQTAAFEARIRDGVGRGLNRQQILAELTEAELKAALGGAVSGRIQAAVVESLNSDPNLSRLIDRLFNAFGGPPADQMSRQAE